MAIVVILLTENYIQMNAFIGSQWRRHVSHRPSRGAVRPSGRVPEQRYRRSSCQEDGSQVGQEALRRAEYMWPSRS
jgi:hypothetical protein